MDYPKISLVTACYNHKEYVAETIESILAQNYPNLQYIVIDDGSTDGSWDIIQKYKDKLFHCERLEGRRDNPTIALNYGFSKTDGEIMGWLNSDDILLPKSLFTIAEIFSQNQEIEWLTGIGTTINSESKIVSSKLIPKNKYDYLSGSWKTIQQESTFWKRSLWKKAGEKLENNWTFDPALWIKFFNLAEHYNANAPLGAFRKGRQNKSTANSAIAEETKKIIKKMRENAAAKEKIETIIYGLAKKISPLLSLIPNSLFFKIPFLNKYDYKLIEYSFAENKWLIRKINPFWKNKF